MSDEEKNIHDVSDTSIWVAYYRAQESLRPDALFTDPLAQILIGDRGKKIAESMKAIGRYTEWAVISRTVIIDGFIEKLISEGIDTVINLGAGLDTRPYRMNLPNSLRWIEVDYPKIIELKNLKLKAESPRCQLSRVALDLADREKRRKAFEKFNADSGKALILTEGVIPYLTESQVSELAKDLREQPHFIFWITEFFNPNVYKYMQGKLRTEKMKNAPFQFFPTDWTGFFDQVGWEPRETGYTGDVSLKSGRPMPMPWWTAPLRLFFGKKMDERSGRMSGYRLLKKKS